MNASTVITNYDCRELFTMGLPVIADNFWMVRTIDELRAALAWAQSHNITPVILGGGSNSLPRPRIDCVIKMSFTDIAWTESVDTATVTVGAGYDWDTFVADSCARGWWDCAALSAIPGTVGASPVQNIGAYGAEVAEIIESLTAWDTETHSLVTITNSECHFGYRTSIFKTTAINRYIICSVTFRLSQRTESIPNYPGVAEEVDRLIMEGNQLSPTTIRTAITNIRWRKLPRPSELGNCGSYFHNPIIPLEQYQRLQSEFPTIPGHPAGDDMIKVPAGWLIDQSGGKGIRLGSFGTSPYNALVVVHYGDGTLDELMAFESTISDMVYDRYGIRLVREPLLLG